jgi:hypothetical protein
VRDWIIRERDISCRLTNHSQGTESVHLVPQTETDWFYDNAMFRYAKRKGCITRDCSVHLLVIEDRRNRFLLRSDIQALFEARRFEVVPKRGVWACHVTSGGPSDQLVALYHNVELQPLTQVAIEFLLARFAWSVFARCTFIPPGTAEPTVGEFPGSCVAAWHEMDEEYRRTEYGIRSTRSPSSRSNSPPSRSNSPPSRSNSPKKRAREGDVPEEDEDGEGDETDELRGRPRKRWCEEERLSGVDALPSPAE